MSSASDHRARRSWPRVVLGEVVGWAYYHCERYVWHERDLAQGPAAASPLPQDVRLRSAVAADIPALVLVEMPMLDRFDEFTARGGELRIAENDGGVVAALWVFRTQMPLYPWLDLPHDVVALEHGVIATGQRGRGLMPAVLDAVADEMRGEGYRSLVLKILDTNMSSLKMAVKAGFRPIALMHQVKILGTHRTVIEPAAGFGRYLAMRLAGSAP